MSDDLLFHPCTVVCAKCGSGNIEIAVRTDGTMCVVTCRTCADIRGTPRRGRKSIFGRAMTSCERQRRFRESHGKIANSGAGK